MKSSVGSFILFSVALCCTGTLVEDEPEMIVSRSLTRKLEVFENKTRCTPGTDFYLACNTCHCPKSGIKSGAPCYSNGCPPLPPLYDSKAKCTPGKSFKLDCNNCYCGDSGTVGGSACTLMGCSHKHP